MQKVSVFISYSHDSEEHRGQVLALSERLRHDGIETFLDQYVNGTPTEGWPRWMLNQLDAADFILVVCTETYYRRFRGQEVPGKGKGADWEGALITQEIYDALSSTLKFIPVFLSSANEQVIPEPMRSATHYALTSDDAYAGLYDSLLGQAGVQPGVVGELKRKPRASGQPLNFREVTSKPGAAMSFPAAAAQKLCSVDISRIDKYAPAELIGRKVETQLLSDAWDKAVRGDSNRPRVLTFVALGGEGKTSLVAKWAADLAHHNWPGCDAVFAWSFYSQGTRDQSAASSDLFLAEALTFFGDPEMAQSSQSAFDKGRRLVRLIGERRVLLVLDGVEPLQYAPTSPTPGELKDAGLAALLKGLAANNQGLCLVTTRYSIPDLNAYRHTTAPETKLLRLSKDAGVSLLKLLGVNGVQAEYETLVEDVEGHALTLNLLGSYLHEAHAGDIRKRDLVKLEEAAEEQGGHAFRVMDAYVYWFATGGKSAEANRKGQRAITVLQLLGLFDRPASADCLAALLKAPVIPDLTEPFASLTEAQRNISFNRLEVAKLITVKRDNAGTLRSLDAHPLLREYFAKQLRTQRPEAWRAAHRRVFERLCAVTKDKRRPTLEDLQPLYQAVVHGCHAGMQQSACDQVYGSRIQRIDHHSAHKLGAYGSNLGAIACFFDTPWSRVSTAVAEGSQAWLLHEAGTSLRALGRLVEAIEPLRISSEFNVARCRWVDASIGTNTLSELSLTLGNLTEAIENAERAVEYAERGNDVFRRGANRTAHADALLQSGRYEVAKTRFCEAETMQSEEQPHFPLLYSIGGFRYCDLLLVQAERFAWQTHLIGGTTNSPAHGKDLPDGDLGTNEIMETDTRNLDSLESCRAVTLRVKTQFEWQFPSDTLLDIALCHLTLGRSGLYLLLLEADGLRSDPAEASDQRPGISGEDRCRFTSLAADVSAAVDGLRRSAQKDDLPRGLLTRAWLRSLNGARTGPESAQGDLDEAWEIAERGPMPLFLADIHLHRARLFGPHASGTIGDQYPWESPAADLTAARQLIKKHGYWRRKEELVDAEVAAKTWVRAADPVRLA
jgi:tetratricopeptide (TPR) repeat protein